MRLHQLAVLALCVLVGSQARAVTEKRDLFYWEPGARFVDCIRSAIPPKRSQDEPPRSQAELDLDSLHFEVERLERLIAISRAAIVLMEREYERGRASAERVKDCRRRLDGVASAAKAITASVVRQGHRNAQECQEACARLVEAVSEEKDGLSRFLPKE